MSKIISKEEMDAFEAWELPMINDDEIRELEEEKVEPLTAEQIEEIQKQAYDEAYQEGIKAGHAEGLAAGRQEGEVEMAEKAAQFSQIISTLDKPFEELDAEVESNLSRLAMIVAKQLVRRELKIDPGQVIALVREAISVLPLSVRNVRVFLHPEDAALVREALSLGEGEQSWKLQEEPTMTRGGCKVITDTSQIDASVESRMAALINKALGGEREDDLPENT